MRIVNIAGGLGNQMFQYAFALMLQRHFPDERVMVDTHHYNYLFFKQFRSINLHNGYEIDSLFSNAHLPIAQRNDLRHVTRYIPNYVLSRIARRLLPQLKTEYVAPLKEDFCHNEEVFREGDTYYEGYWQSISWFDGMQQELTDTFSPPEPNRYNQQLIQQIEKDKSVGIHVRKGDYAHAPEFNNICTMGYYRKAIDQILTDGEQRTFYIFSNDIEWCKNVFPSILGQNPIVFVDGNRGRDSHWDLFLMTHCRELIIANSTFSWWGAYLNNNARAIYVPAPWLKRECKIDIYSPHWKKINISDNSTQ